VADICKVSVWRDLYLSCEVIKVNFFKDSTRGLILPNDAGYTSVNSYKHLQEVNSVCVMGRNSAVPLVPSIILLLAVFSVFALMY
jgi:hypothetical protein